ncbi:hypothetical protein [Dialister invisus]|jgi:hypothetical protein|uniref:hypothetical protein n=1 Tax=Dialister invisus TaxID=218538 RepID=UPI00265B2D07|nr:hypothetical protein [Dialister invisus]
MKKIDWKNLSYYDFIGFVAVTAILLFVLYFGGLWYATYDYRIQMRDQMVEMYRQLPNPIPPIKDDYGVHKRWLVYCVTGTREFNRDLKDNEFDLYGKKLVEQGWQIDKKYTDSNQYGKSTSIVLRKGDFLFEITRWEGKKICRFHLIKEDWIYNKGF